MLEHETGLSSDSLPLEDLFLDQDGSKPTQSYYSRNISPFEVFDPPYYSGAVLSHSNIDTVDKMLFGTDSEDGHDLVDTNELTAYEKTAYEKTAYEKTASGEISIDLDEINESDFQKLTYPRTVGFLAAPGGETISARIPLQLVKVDVSRSEVLSFLSLLSRSIWNLRKKLLASCICIYIPSGVP